jgi:hypothetical protein
VKFPRIAIKLRPGTLTVRETEKILDEKVIQRTQEVASPTTGIPKLQTFEYVEKIIEKEVSKLIIWLFELFLVCKFYVFWIALFSVLYIFYVTFDGCELELCNFREWKL